MYGQSDSALSPFQTSFSLPSSLSRTPPLAFLTTYSYRRLNVLHRLAAYLTIVWGMLHGVAHISALNKLHILHELSEKDFVFGIVAVFAMLVILASALLLRKLRYEVFYIIRSTMYMLILIAVGMHRPDFSKLAVIVTIFAACMWITDRLLRGSKLALVLPGNTTTVTPLPHGGTRIVLRRSSWRAVAGTHCFLWILAIQSAETDPITVVSIDPLELIVNAYDGFTRYLHAYALKHFGKALRASADGLYDDLSDFSLFDTVISIAGIKATSHL